MPTKRYGLIGFPLSHSFSAIYFAEKFHKHNIDAEYLNYEYEDLSGIREKMMRAGVSGFNVTTPHKERIIEYLDEISEDAAEIKAVNTVKIENGVFKGFNTDYMGFMESIRPYINYNYKQGLILGTGGAARAVTYALEKLGVAVVIVSRNRGLTYDYLDREIMHKMPLIVNTTPLGTWPKVEECPNIPYNCLGIGHIVYDLVYNPEKSLFLKKAEAQGSFIKNGMEMLERQAELSWKLWNQNE